jgi:transposase InsO family protein
MSHRNARLTVHGRLLLVQRIRVEGVPIAHAAKAMGVSRQCAHRWVKRFDAEGEPGLHDRSSRPHRQPTKTPAAVEAEVLAKRAELRCGPDGIFAATGVPARTVTAILRRNNTPRLAECDPLTGEVIRASRVTTKRYEHKRPGDLVHVDVKKLGRVPVGGGWKAHGRQMGSTGARKRTKVGFDFIHSMVDDHSRLAYSEILNDEKGDTCAGFLERAGVFFAANGIGRIRRVMTDNHWSYTRSTNVADAIAAMQARHVLIRPHCPWQNGKVERFNRTLQTEWAYRQVFTSNQARTDAFAPWLEHYNNHRRHSALGGHPPVSRLSPT